ncbi:hypothetical protein ACVIN2_000881 [Bradyrhizobium sp. USDA 3650]
MLVVTGGRVGRMVDGGLTGALVDQSVAPAKGSVGASTH